jgi:hypothetical protein
MLHHVYSFSQTKTFQIKLYEGDPPSPVVFDKAGVVAVGCNIHDWMQAYLSVIDTPHFAVTDARGCAHIAGLRGGELRARAWHPACGGEWRRRSTGRRRARHGSRSRSRRTPPSASPSRRSIPRSTNDVAAHAS